MRALRYEGPTQGVALARHAPEPELRPGEALVQFLQPFAAQFPVGEPARRRGGQGQQRIAHREKRQRNKDHIGRGHQAHHSLRRSSSQNGTLVEVLPMGVPGLAPTPKALSQSDSCVGGEIQWEDACSSPLAL